MRNKQNAILDKLILSYLFCYFMLIFGFPHIVTLILGAALCVAMMLKQKKFRLDIGVCLLAFSMIMHFVILYGKSGLFSMITYVPIVLYVVAHYAGCEIKNSSDMEKRFLLLVMTLVLGHTIHGILNSALYLMGYHTTARKWLDIWSQQIVAGTQQVVYFLPALAMFLPACIYMKKKKSVSVFVIAVTALFCYISLVSKSRTSIMILGIVMCSQIVLCLMLERKKIKDIIWNKKFGMIAISLVVVVFLVAILVKDTAVVQEFLENMSKDGGILNNVRFVAQREALGQVFDYVWGGRQMNLSLNYLHNVWLDMANATGIFPFVAFTTYTFFTLYEMIRFLIKDAFQTETKLIVAGIYLAFFLYFTVEPALDASIHYLTPWFFMNGLVHSSLSKCD